MSQDYSDRPPEPGYEPYGAEEPPKKRSPLIIILIVLGFGGGMILLACCCGGGLMMWFGMDMAGEQLADQVRGEPAVVEHIGEITSSNVDLMATATRGEEDVMVVNLEGTKGNGVLVARVDRQQVVSATLELPTGETFELLQNAEPLELDSLD